MAKGSMTKHASYLGGREAYFSSYVGECPLLSWQVHVQSCLFRSPAAAAPPALSSASSFRAFSRCFLQTLRMNID